MKLTDSQREALRVITIHGSIDPFDYGSTTIAVLHHNGLIERRALPPASRSYYVITDAGRAALGEP